MLSAAVNKPLFPLTGECCFQLQAFTTDLILWREINNKKPIMINNKVSLEINFSLLFYRSEKQKRHKLFLNGLERD